MLTDPYNTAIKHLQGLYGRELGYTCSFQNKLRKARNKTEYAELEKMATDRDKNIIIRKDLIDKNSPDYVMWLLVGQYNLGPSPKKELKEHLTNRKINFVD